MSKQKRSGVHYVDNKEFHTAILKYHEACKTAKKQGRELPRIPDYIGSCIWKIAEKLSLKPCFINYSFREDMVADGIENCILYFHDFDPDKGSNPFSYFTQVIYYAFLRRIYKEQKNRYTTYKHFQETIGHVIYDELKQEDNMHITAAPYDNMYEFMGKFEKREENKKTKRKAVKEGLSKYYEDE